MSPARWALAVVLVGLLALAAACGWVLSAPQSRPNLLDRSLPPVREAPRVLEASGAAFTTPHDT